jgi:hypothetical protein
MQSRIVLFTFLFFFGVFFARVAFADLAFSRNARTFETQHSSLMVKGLAHACLSITLNPDGLPCNPALAPLNKKPSLGAEALLSNGFSTLKNVRALVNGNINDELIGTLFAEGQIMQIESNIDINFVSKYLNAQYSPLSIKGFSVVRNEANPDVDLYAIEEEGFTFQSGYEIFDDFFAGLQIRATRRKFIRQRFKLIALGTQEGKDLLIPKLQNAVYFEPGLTWFFKSEWRPRISLFITNFGNLSKKYEELKTPVEAQVGFGIAPPLPWGELELSLEYRSLNYEEKDLQKLHLGSVYKFGSMFLTGGLDTNGISGGVFYYLDKINAGVIYSTTKFLNENENYFTQTVYLQLGWQI